MGFLGAGNAKELPPAERLACAADVGSALGSFCNSDPQVQLKVVFLQNAMLRRIGPPRAVVLAAPLSRNSTGAAMARRTRSGNRGIKREPVMLAAVSLPAATA